MKKPLKLVWNVYDFHFSDREFRLFNVFNHRSFTDAVEKLLKTEISKDEFAEKLRRQLQYYYWSKTEWECIITDTQPHISRRELERFINECHSQQTKDAPPLRRFCINLADADKIDVYDQVRLNWDEFVDYVWGQSKFANKE